MHLMKWTENECKMCRHENVATNETRPYYQILKASNEFKGTFIHPDLIHFVAQWVDVSYAFAVKHVMDSINDKVHEVLKKNELPDTPEKLMKNKMMVLFLCLKIFWVKLWIFVH